MVETLPRPATSTRNSLATTSARKPAPTIHQRRVPRLAAARMITSAVTLHTSDSMAWMNSESNSAPAW